MSQNVIDVFNKQRFKIKFVRNIKIRADRFGIIVNNNRLVAVIFYPLNCVNRAIIELYTLTDSYRSGTDYDNFFLIRNNILVIFLVSRVIIRCLRLKFRRAGIDNLVYGINSVRPSQSINNLLRLSRKQTDFIIGKAHRLSLFEQFHREIFFLQLIFGLYNVFKLIQKPLVDFGKFINFIDGKTSSQSRRNRVNSLIIRDFEFFDQIFIRKFFIFFASKTDDSSFKANERL